MKAPFRRLLFCSCICKNSSSGSSGSSSSSRQLFGHAAQAFCASWMLQLRQTTLLQQSRRASGPHSWYTVKHPLRVLLMREPDKRRTKTQIHRQTDRHTKEAKEYTKLGFALLCLIDCVFLFFFLFFFTIFCFCFCFSFVLFRWSFFFWIFFFFFLVAAWLRLPAANPNDHKNNNCNSASSISINALLICRMIIMMCSSSSSSRSWSSASDSTAKMHDDHHHLSFFFSFFLSSSWHQAKIAKFFLRELQSCSSFHFFHCKNSGKAQNAHIFLTVSSSSSSVWNSSLAMEIGWMNEWLDGWMQCWMDGWINEWMDEYMVGWMDE